MWVKQTSVKIRIKQRRVRKNHIFCFSTILVWTAPLPLLSLFLPPILSDLSPALSPQVLLHNLQMPRVNQPLSKCIENLNLTAKLETRYEYIAQSTSFLSASAKQAIQWLDSSCPKRSGWILLVFTSRHPDHSNTHRWWPAIADWCFLQSIPNHIFAIHVVRIFFSISSRANVEAGDTICPSQCQCLSTGSGTEPMKWSQNEISHHANQANSTSTGNSIKTLLKS